MAEPRGRDQGQDGLAVDLARVSSPFGAATARLAPCRDADHAALTGLLADDTLLRSLYPQSLRPPALAAVFADWTRLPDLPQDFQLTLMLDGGCVVGCVRLERQQLSYFVGRPYWGQGLGRRAVALTIDGWLRTRPGSQVRALVARDNLASCRVLLRNGFVFSGIVPGPARVQCVQAYTYRAPGLDAGSLGLEEGAQAVVDRR